MSCRWDRTCIKSPNRLQKIQATLLRVNLRKKHRSKSQNLVFKRIYRWVFTHSRHKLGIINLLKDLILVIIPQNFSLRFYSLERHPPTNQDPQVANLQCFTRNLKFQMLITVWLTQNNQLRLRQVQLTKVEKVEIWVLTTSQLQVWNKKLPIKVLLQLIEDSAKLNKKFLSEKVCSPSQDYKVFRLAQPTCQ